jgi:rRNA maturation RNase YbeY
MPSQIHFFYEETKFRFKASQKTKAWIKNIVERERKSLGDLNFIFCSDKFLHRINVDYLNHDTLTDIVTFDSSESSGLIEGDIYISIERVEENAKRYKASIEQELHRVIIHGVLHLIGYADKTAHQKKMMRKKEAACLSLRTF